MATTSFSASTQLAGAGAVIAPCSLWLASRTWPTVGANPLVVPQGNAAPAGSADFGPVTSGTGDGGPGTVTISGVTQGDYFFLVAYLGTNYWSGPYSLVENSDVFHLDGTETATGNKTFSGAVSFTGTVAVPSASIGVAGLSGVLPVANGGTGSGTQNFADLTTAQSIGGVKTFTAQPVLSAGLDVTGGTIVLPNGSIPTAAIAGFTAGFAGVDIGSTQTITGPKTLENTTTLLGANLVGTAVGPPATPTVTPTLGSATLASYALVSTTYAGTDSMIGLQGFTAAGAAVLDGTHFNTVTWSAVAGAASYKVLKLVAGVWEQLAAGVTALTYADIGGATSAYVATTNVNPGGSVVPSGATGISTFGDLTTGGGRFIGTAIGTPTAPTVTPTGGSATNWRYETVAVTPDGRDSLPSSAGQTNTGAASLTHTAFNTVTWSAVAGAASYKLLKYNGSIYQLLQANITGLSFVDYGDITPGAYVAATSNPGGELTATTLTALNASTTSTAANFNAGGITSARFLGKVAGAAPTGGPYLAGDWVFDSTYQGQWFCTAGGSPGTWKLLYGNAIRARMHLSGSVAQSNGVAIPFDTKDFTDTLSMDTIGAGAKITVPVAGDYQVTGQGWSTAYGTWGVAIYKNGSSAVQGTQVQTNDNTMIATDVMALAANDFVQLVADGAFTTFNGGAAANFLTVRYIGNSG